MDSSTVNRPLTKAEYQLARFMLESGTVEAKGFLSQLEQVEVTPWHCPCGCASIDFELPGEPPPPPGMRILADFLIGTDADLAGVFIYEYGGQLSGIEVYGLAGDAPSTLPSVGALHPLPNSV